MQTVGAFEAKTHLSRLLASVKRGETFTITHHGQPIAKLVPVDELGSAKDITSVITKLNALSRRLTLGCDWRQLRDEGRR